MKIAFCISGEVRTWNRHDIYMPTPYQTILKVKQNLEDKGHVVDVYGFTWDYCDIDEISIFENLHKEDSSTKRKWIDQVFEPRYTMGFKQHKHYNDGLFNMIGPMYGITDAFYRAGNSYDFYIRLRFDGLFLRDGNDIDVLLTSFTFMNGLDVPAIDAPHMMYKDGSVSYNTDIFYIINNLAWQQLFSNTSPGELLDKTYMTPDDFARGHFAIYYNIDNVALVSTIYKQICPVLKDPSASKYFSLTDIEKRNYDRSKRPI